MEGSNEEQNASVFSHQDQDTREEENHGYGCEDFSTQLFGLPRKLSHRIPSYLVANLGIPLS